MPRQFLQTIGITAAILSMASIILAAFPQTRIKPNVIIIFTDDQGYHDLGCYGSSLIKTPNLDRMAKEGIWFTDFYSSAAICTPSRASLLTGCYPPRVSLTAVLFPEDKYGLNPNETTIAELLKVQGYATACIGKWHLGEPPDFLPTHYGFDYFYGLPFSNDDDRSRYKPDFPRLMRNDQVIEKHTSRALMTKHCTEEAIHFIEQNQEHRFFVYLAHPMPHVKLDASEGFKGRSKRGLYGDVIEEIDWSVGQILAKLQQLSLDKKTLVIFSSDNGPWLNYDGKGIESHGGSAEPLRGGKFSTYEGGFRVPCIMWWPGKIPAGKVCSEVAGTIDLLPTITKLAGGKVPKDRIIDGRDIWPLMLCMKGAKSPHDAYFYYKGNTLEAVRSKKWKLRRENEIELYNLESDIGEQNNLAQKYPEVVKSLVDLMNDFDHKLNLNKRPAGEMVKK